MPGKEKICRFVGYIGFAEGIQVRQFRDFVIVVVWLDLT